MTERVGIVGLGYVGLPLARAFAEAGLAVVGIDANEGKVRSLAEPFEVSTDPAALRDCTVFVLCVPTPASDRRPDLRPLASAARSIAPHVGPGSLVVVESTVHIGGTDYVRSILAGQGARGFSMAFAPERVSPGDRKFGGYVKVIAADTEALPRIEALYRRIFDRVHIAPSIEVAEAAKLLENAQRDINIALVNEAAAICESHGVSIHDVLDAAATKWNFARYEPGLVGGHCIAVDPWYLLASGSRERVSVIEAARVVNDSQPSRMADRIQALTSPCRRVLILGASFKPGVEDTRNSGAIAVARLLRSRGVEVDVFDPRAGYETQPGGAYDVAALLVAHPELVERASEFAQLLRPGGEFLDPWRSAPAL